MVLDGVRYDHVRTFTGGGWRVIRIGPKGGHKTVAVYREEDPAREAAATLNRLRVHEL